MIPTNGLHLAYESVDTAIHYIQDRKDGSIWTDTAGVSLPPVFSHHTTSVDNFNRDNYGLKSQLKQLSKDSLWSSLTRKRGILPSNPLNREALDFFNSLYLTSVIVVTLLAYNRYKQNHWLFGTKTNIEFNFQTTNETKLHKVNHYVSDIEISLYCLLPLRTMSRIWGQINSIPLPVSMRKVVINGYIKSFGCNLDEALDTDLTNYKNLSEFFRRSLKPGVRPIHSAPGVVSPADGTVLHFGQVWDGRIEQVKGITYSLRKFLGPQIWCPTQDSPIDYQRRLLLNNSPSNPTALYSCVVYLSPGDYHRFHSPADWSVDYRRHFAGHLLSVNPGVVRLFPQLFTLNERVVYSGRWPYGYFSMTAVGATAVGTVRVYFDEVGSD
ncbi:unnamed protein product [Medioppia subpectinata]|uniref:phosphatidylserine decarboxylase n=1 Tax=Medioppia subpectinata TaxID=1979941 RepID=A0A7R9L1N9_9ACAR|nr:unnamed protein product [Medioppia subpectinata]CAG2113592.1 unnamed protein product [Medioppia subpectinata]